MFEYFIKLARTERYHLMCSICAHYKQQHLFDDERSTGYRTIPKNATAGALKALGATLNSIDC